MFNNRTCPVFIYVQPFTQSNQCLLTTIAYTIYASNTIDRGGQKHSSLTRLCTLPSQLFLLIFTSIAQPCVFYLFYTKLVSPGPGRHFRSFLSLGTDPSDPGTSNASYFIFRLAFQRFGRSGTPTTISSTPFDRPSPSPKHTRSRKRPGPILTVRISTILVGKRARASVFEQSYHCAPRTAHTRRAAFEGDTSHTSLEIRFRRTSHYYVTKYVSITTPMHVILCAYSNGWLTQTLIRE